MRRTLLIATLVLSCLASAQAASVMTIATADPAANVTYTGPAWSPDGRMIAYVQVKEDVTNVYVAAMSGSKWKSRLLVSNADHPVWSPDGKKLAVSHGGLATVVVSGGKIAQITKAASDFPLSWSPNARYIVHATLSDAGAPQPMMRDLKAAKNLSTDPGVDGGWISSGKLLATSCGIAAPAEGGWVKEIDPASGKARPIIEDQCIWKVFAPKGAGYAWAWIATNAPNGEGIYQLNLQTGGLTKLIAVRAREMYWSPNAKQFAFITEYSPGPGVEPRSTLYVGNTQNWAFKIAAKDASKTDDKLHPHAQWSPNSKSIAYVSESGDVRILKL